MWSETGREFSDSRLQPWRAKPLRRSYHGSPVHMTSSMEFRQAPLMLALMNRLRCLGLTVRTVVSSLVSEHSLKDIRVAQLACNTYQATHGFCRSHSVASRVLMRWVSI